MENINHFSLMIDALTELAEEEQAHPTAPIHDAPTLSAVIADISPLPPEAIFLGLAEDGLPILLNYNDATAGPILIVSDQASGKTSMLKMIARAIELIHLPSKVQYSVITQYINEWNGYQDNQNSIGIYTTQDHAAEELLTSLVEWAHNNKHETRTILLLIDDLESMTKLDQQAEQNLRWLLLRGPSRRIWPILTLNANSAQNIEAWLSFFRTRLFGHIQDSQNAYLVTGHIDKSLQELNAGSQFTMLEGNTWINFHIPIID